jgi:WD40 repeat protein
MVRSYDSENLPIVAMLTERQEILVYDFQKERLLNYLVSHYGEVIKVLVDEKSRINIYSLGKDNRIIYWRFQGDKWTPRVYDFNRILRDDAKVARAPSTYSITDFLVYSVREELYVSDNLGRIIAVKISDNTITEVHCFFQLEIQSIVFSPNQSYIAVFYSSGCCQIVSSQSFMIELNLVDHMYDPTATNRPIGRVRIKEDLRRMKEVFSSI